MYILTPESMRKSDQDTIKAGFPEILLMEAAAAGTADYADEIIEDKILNTSNYYRRPLKKKDDVKVLIFVGSGNNGGDGLAAARILKRFGYQTEIILSRSADDLSGINETNFQLCRYNEIKYYEYSDLSHDFIMQKIEESDLILDALLGTGISGKVRGSTAEIIELINLNADKFSKSILAVDIPSGINGNTGEVMGSAVKADYTASMAAYKRGLLLFPGRSYSGKVKIIDIGINDETIRKNSDGLKLFTKEEAVKLLPKRKTDGHKGTFGRTAFLAGSRGMTGAPLLSSEAALRSGSGLVYLLLPDEIEKSVSVQLNEVISVALPSFNGIIDKNTSEKVLDFIENIDVLAVGPGMGVNKNTELLLKDLLEKADLPMVLDADALNSIKDLDLLKSYKNELVLTPHPGEMSRLTGMEIEEINKNRIDTARNFASEYGVNIILKGAATVTASPDGSAYINNTGTNGMATAGSGDVLTGITASIMGQKMNAFKAAAFAVYIHGKAGEFAAEQRSDFALKSGDIIDSLAEAWNYII